MQSATAEEDSAALLRRLEQALGGSETPAAGGLARGLTRLMADAADPLERASAALAAWHARHPLREDEVAALFEAMLRSLRSMAARGDAGGEAGAARSLLEKLRRVGPRLAHGLFRGACGWPPSPAEPAIAAWLAAHRGGFAPVVGVDLAGAPIKVLAFGDPAIRSREDWAAAIAATGATEGDVTIGRYAEARAVYDTEAYASSFNSADRRNVHLGIDIGVPAGTTVHAPLDGSVHSFADNDMSGDYGPTIILEHRPAGLPAPFYTLYGHLRRASLDGLEAQRPVRRGQRIGWVGEAHENGGWPPHLHFQLMTDMLGLDGNFFGVGEASKLGLWTSLCPDPNLILGLEL